MKILKPLVIMSIFSLFSSHLNAAEKTKTVDPDVLIGTWKLDMTPANKSDDNYALMRINAVINDTFGGVFYREGVEIQNARLNVQNSVLYGALVSGDNSGKYNTTFYYEDGVLYGSTHAIDRKFLSVWEAKKSTAKN